MGQNLGVIQVDITNCAAITPGDGWTVSLPSEIMMAAPGPVTITEAPLPDNGTSIVIPTMAGGNPNGLVPASIDSAFVGPTGNSLDITFTGIAN